MLEPVPPMAVGESRNLTCRVLEVAPVANLTVTLRRGAETLRTEGFGAAEGSVSVAVRHLLTASPGDHGQDVTCHAELSLRPHGPLFARAAGPVKLSVFGESSARGQVPAVPRGAAWRRPQPGLSGSIRGAEPNPSSGGHAVVPECPAPALARGPRRSGGASAGEGPVAGILSQHREGTKPGPGGDTTSPQLSPSRRSSRLPPASKPAPPPTPAAGSPAPSRPRTSTSPSPWQSRASISPSRQPATW